MLESVEKALLAGIGTLSLSQKKAEELFAELQKQFNFSEEKGREMLTALQETARENQKKLEELALQELHKASERLGLVTAEQFNELQRRVAELEARLAQKG